MSILSLFFFFLAFAYRDVGGRAASGTSGRGDVTEWRPGFALRGYLVAEALAGAVQQLLADVGHDRGQVETGLDEGLQALLQCFVLYLNFDFHSC